MNFRISKEVEKVGSYSDYKANKVHVYNSKIEALYNDIKQTSLSDNDKIEVMERLSEELQKLIQEMKENNA